MTTQSAPDTRRDSIITLTGGRSLGYAEYGATGGKPIFYFHGLPGSRIGGAVGHDRALARGVRVIAPDRPGFGLSSFQQKRRITDWPADVAQLADKLGIDRFAVMGVSGGGPYAAACAHALSERVTGAAIVSGIGPFSIPGATNGMLPTNRLLFGLTRRLPFVATILLGAMGFMLKRANEDSMKRFLKAMPPADQRVLEDPAVRSLLLADTKEAFRHGSRGAARDTVLAVKPWEFRLEDIRVPVHVWQGGADRNVPAAHGRHQAAAIPGSTLHYYEDSGHLLIVERMDEIIDAIT